MKSMVTGGAGFIGSHLTERLIGNDRYVSVIDNCSTGRWANLAHLVKKDLLSCHEGDINDPAVLDVAIAGVDWVFHMAALADIVPSIERPTDYMRANLDGTAAVLEAARTAGVKRFVYASSSSCNGIPDQYPTPETAEFVRNTRTRCQNISANNA